MSRTVVDINRALLDAARKELGTTTIKDTVNEALRLVVEDRVRSQLAALASYPEEGIADFLAWRRARDTRIS